jgi:hypothetical protein
MKLPDRGKNSTFPAELQPDSFLINVYGHFGHGVINADNI